MEDKIKASRTPLSYNKWQDVKEDIEYKILAGVFTAGERIPPTRKIAKDYNIGQSTAQKVLNKLCQEGVIESKRGIGYFVKPYTKEQILTDRKRNLEKTVLNAVREAELINVDLLPMIEKMYKYKKT